VIVECFFAKWIDLDVVQKSIFNSIPRTSLTPLFNHFSLVSISYLQVIGSALNCLCGSTSTDSTENDLPVKDLECSSRRILRSRLKEGEEATV